MKTNLIAFPTPVLSPARRPMAAEPESAAKPRRKYQVKGQQVGPGYQPEAGWKPLSRAQKTKLVLLARDASAKQYLPGSGPEHNAWRQEQAIHACGLRISEARQRDWNALLVHFQLLCGQDVKAFKSAMRADGNPHRVAMYKLRQELKRKDKAEAYAETICQSKFRCALRDATAPQVWSIIFDLRGRK